RARFCQGKSCLVSLLDSSWEYLYAKSSSMQRDRRRREYEIADFRQHPIILRGGCHMEIKEYLSYDEKEILALYESVGWTAYTENPAALRLGFAHSLLTLAAYEGERLLGLVRTVGDGHTIVFIQDILVHPA